MPSFFVRGEPKGQPRVKARSWGKHASVYDPGTADGWKNCVVRDARPYRPEEPLEGPVETEMVFFFSRPKRLLRKKDPEEPIWHTSKPDKDNLEKAVLDALTADGWFRDDAQVCSGGVKKVYCAKAGVPGCWISVRLLQGRPHALEHSSPRPEPERSKGEAPGQGGGGEPGDPAPDRS